MDEAEESLRHRENFKQLSDEITDTDDDDSGLVLDDLDVLPDEDLLELDYDLDLDLSNENFGGDDICVDTKLYNHENSEEQNYTHTFKNGINSCLIQDSSIPKINTNITHEKRSLPIQSTTNHKPIEDKNESDITHSKHTHSGKLVAFSKEQARQWRRKRILNAPASSKDNDKTVQKHGNLKPLMPLPTRLKPLSGKEKHLSKHETLSDKKLSNPLLGGEKTNRGPLPMKLRALPSTFWKEPQSNSTSSLAGSNYSILPPLFSAEANHSNEEVIDVRPVTPEEKGHSPRHSPRHKKKWIMTSPPDTELLFSLFDHLAENKVDERLIVRRGRPKKNQSERTPPPPPRDKNDDPCIVDALATKLFPELSLHQRPGQEKSSTPNFAIIRIGKGERTMEFPALQADQNYPAILNELVTHM